VKLYTYTTERSLARMALKGMPRFFPMWGSVAPASEMAEMDKTPKDIPVVLEIDIDGLESILAVSPERVEDVASMAQDDVENDPDLPEGQKTEAAAEKAYSDVYDAAENLSSVEDMIEKFDVVENTEEIGPSRIKVLGIPDIQYPDDVEEEPKVSFEESPRPLKAYKQPLVTRLLRSIFLPRHKLYGAHKRRRPMMGLISRFIPRAQEEEVFEEPPADVVDGIPLVWASGKTFRRGMRGAFGPEDGDAIAQMVALRVGREPGKYLGSGARGAAYSLEKNRALKVTMDGNEIFAAANLIGIRHPNLATVYDVFIVTDGKAGAGIIVRDAIDTTLDKFDPKAADALDKVMDDAFLSASEKIERDASSIADIDPDILAQELEMAIDVLREIGCDLKTDAVLDLADAFRELRHLGIVGIDFDSGNIGIVRKPKPRAVIFDYGMTKSPAVQIEVLSLEQMQR